MKVLVCGSRHFNDYDKLKEVLDGIGITEVIEGEARGADRLSAKWAEEMDVPVRKFPADWSLHGKRAGPIRNSQMLKEGQPEMVVAFRASNSRGTQNMITQASKAGIPVKVIEVGND